MKASKCLSVMGGMSGVLLSLLAAGCSSRIPQATGDLALTNVVCTARFIRETGSGNFSKISVTYRNVSKSGEVFKAPFPLDERRTEEPELPFLVVVLRGSSSGVEEEFGYTVGDDKKEQLPAQITVASGETKTVDYPLSEFWRWGTSGPDRWGSFLKYIQPGTNEVSARVVVIWKDQRIDSGSEKLLCSFPDWLFKPKQ